jgi:putative oxidoreductase
MSGEHMMNSKLNCLLQIPSQQKCASGALLFLRLVVGTAFIIHGWGKMQSPFGWMPPEAPVPGVFQFLAAISEFGGGIALVLGLLTRVAMLGLGFTMLTATCMLAFVNHNPFVSMGGPAFELPLVYFSIAVLIFHIGPGMFSLDSKVFGTK